MIKKHKLNNFVHWFTKITAYPLTLLFFKPKVFYTNKKIQSKKLPKSAIIISNHKSLMDFPLYLFLFFTRRVRFLIAEVMFAKNKIFSWFLFALGGIYVNRDVYNFDFVGESLEVLDKGGVIGVFPQGRLPVKDKPEWPYKAGVVYIALKTDAPIIPVYTDGNYGITKRTKVVIGEPIYLRKIASCDNPTIKEIEQLAKFLEDKNFELKNILESRLLLKNEKE